MIRWTDVKLSPGPDGSHTGKIHVELLAYDRDGNALNWTGATEAMSLKPDIFAAIEHSGVPAHLEIDVPTGIDVYLATGVFDCETGKAGNSRDPAGQLLEKDCTGCEVPASSELITRDFGSSFRRKHPVVRANTSHMEGVMRCQFS